MIHFKETEKYAHKPHVLVVDDDRRIRDLVTRFLQEHDFIAFGADSAAQAREALHRFSFDVLVVDVMMPEEDGFAFTKTFRQNSQIPVILLTALGEAKDRITGLEAGADDYLSKPFEPRELILRLQAILKRTRKPEKENDQFRIGPWVYTLGYEEILQDDGTLTRLTSTEANLLRALCLRVGQVVSREELASLIDVAAGERTIDVQVTRLRRKIESNTKTPRYLQTLRGRGYMLRAQRLE